MAVNDNPTGKIGNQVWLDANENGLFDAGEAGIGGIQVELVGTFDNGGGSFTKTKTTNDNGRYVFSNLITGDGVTYSVNFSGLPEGFEFTQPNVGNNEGKDSDPNTNGSVNNITLDPGQNRLDIDAGLVDTSGSGGSGTHCSISGQVRNDTDADGDLSDSDAGIAGVTVQLFADFDANGREDAGGPIQTVTTDADGNYTFDDLEYGRYIVREVDPNGATSTADSNGANPNRVIGINVTPQTPTITGIDFLDTFGGGGNPDPDPDPTNGSISGQVRNDVDGDGNLNDPDAGIAGVTVQLASTTNPGQVIATEVTDGNGNFSFEGLDDGTYIVREVNPDGFTSTADSNGFNPDQIAGINIRNGSSRTDLVFLDTADTLPPVNSDPNANNDNETTTLNTPVAIDVLGNDSDPENDPLSVTSVEGQSITVGQSIDTNNGSVMLLNNGELSFTPNDGFVGNEVFAYHVSDGNGGEDTAQVRVSVTPPANTAPTAVNDSDTTALNTPVTIDVLGNDSDPESDPLNITEVSDPLNGSVQIVDGQIEYTPDDGFIGNDVFTYDISDGNGGTDTARVNVTVTPPANTAPDAVNDTATTDSNTPVSINVLGNDSDPENDPLSVTSIDGQAVNPGDSIDVGNGTATLLNNGQIEFTPDNGFSGQETFSYHVSDGNGGEDTANVTVDVTQPQPTSGTIVGSGSIREDSTEGYRIQLDQAVTEDTFVTVRIKDGTAQQTDESAVFEYFVEPLIYNVVGIAPEYDPNSYNSGYAFNDIVQFYTPNQQARDFTFSTWFEDPSWSPFVAVNSQTPGNATGVYDGVNALVNDFRVFNPNGDVVTGDTFTVRVQAGSNTSEEFQVRANQEVNVGQTQIGFFDTENTENFSLHVESIGGNDATGDLEIDILDKRANISPIAFDLNDNGIQTLSINEGVKFDILNTGEAVNTGWISGDDGFLAIDNDGDGQISDRSELFGGGVGDGFEKLASFDTNGDSVVDINDAQFGDLLVWQDTNENGITDAGELTDLLSAGIASINTNYTNVFETDAQGNIHGEVSTALGTDGREIQTTDVYFQVSV